MDNMVQFTITGVENVLELITLVHKDILDDDKFWHFFNEEEEGIFLRCSKHYEKDVNIWLSNNSYKFTEKEYKDDAHIVKLFPHYFMKIFHLNSLLAIEFYEGKFVPKYDVDKKAPSKRQINIAKSIWVGSIAERISHCFLNNLQDYTVKFREESEMRFGDDDAWESFVLAEQLIDRSIWTGMRKAYLNAKNKVDKGEDDTK